jgi:hypothetical protein
MHYVKNSKPAKRWTKLLGHEMHEVRIEANALVLELVFHDMLVDELAIGDPDTRRLRPKQRREPSQTGSAPGTLGGCAIQAGTSWSGRLHCLGWLLLLDALAPRRKPGSDHH